jgi:hypothetical protein
LYGQEYRGSVQAIHAALLMNQMVIVSAGGAFGAYGASATTGPDSPGIDEKELEGARALGKRVAEFAAIIQRGSRTWFKLGACGVETTSSGGLAREQMQSLAGYGHEFCLWHQADIGRTLL